MIERLWRYITKQYLYKKATYYARLSFETDNKEYRNKAFNYLGMYNDLEYEDMCK